MNSRKNLIIIIVSTVFLLAVSLLFREKIAGLLSFNAGQEDLFETAVEKDSLVIGDRGSGLGEDAKKEETVKPIVAEKPLPKKGPPLYTGRDPAEVRPIPE